MSSRLEKKFKNMKAKQFFAEGRRLKRRCQHLMDHGLFDQYRKTEHKLDVWTSVKEKMQQGQFQEKKESTQNHKEHDRVRFLDRQGQIYRVHRNGTYDIRFDDGQTEKNVGHDLLQKIVSSRRFRLKDHVMVRFRGGKRTYPGTIAHVHHDGTYSIDYNDGDFEKYVSASMISRSLSSSSGSSIGSIGSDKSLTINSPRLPRSIPSSTKTTTLKTSTTASPTTKNIKASRPRPRPRKDQQNSCSVM